MFYDVLWCFDYLYLSGLSLGVPKMLLNYMYAKWSKTVLRHLCCCLLSPLQHFQFESNKVTLMLCYQATVISTDQWPLCSDSKERVDIFHLPWHYDHQRWQMTHLLTNSFSDNTSLKSWAMWRAGLRVSKCTASKC